MVRSSPWAAPSDLLAREPRVVCISASRLKCKNTLRGAGVEEPMAIGLVHLFEAGLLLMNAAAILNEKRFLRKYGLDSAIVGENLGPKNQVASFLHAMRTFMRYPLVAMNVLVIIYEMILG
ncbi:unnamed protein product [Effrenium voratum]|uniref:Immediate early response 3-interacting protein 1 n=1 Tax=Effrenium voratum TaxID=2562239 RepID=A0AA36N310_9DINO|nr:unnamed protein product [Effrenium voratum]CAJ1388771.1 unnamed protein product [Effrenium voratum]CAJ1449174.1 unnamed protein product [Effrenium voratum]